jgi:pyruvate dehydrogenase E1 component alpha subunit/2-oxoisovalerate dehydrogenase E1 component alpha subunit
MISHLGAMIPVVCGMLLARRMQGKDMGVGATCIGDGGTSTGAFHEGLNLAAVEKLPLVLVVANNQFAYSTPNTRQFACAAIEDKAAGYGIAAHSCDGTDLGHCLDVLAAAVAAARDGGGPQLVVARLLRLCGHGEHDDAGYIQPDQKSGPLGRDCLESARATAITMGWITPDALAAMDEDIQESVLAAVARAQNDPAPDPFTENWQALVSVPS